MTKRSAEPDLADLVAPLWTAEHTRRTLGLTPEAMDARRADGSLLAVTTSDGDLLYPVHQFERRNERTRVKPALGEFMTVLRDRNPWTIAVLVVTPAPELDGLTPLDWVREHRPIEPLVDYAGILRAEHAR